MILTAILATLVLAAPVQDYFPLTPGTKWTYEDENGLQMMEEVGKPMDRGNNRTATPISQSAAGPSLGAHLYGVDGDSVLLYGTIDTSQPKKDIAFLREPEPVLRVTATKADWQYVGELPTGAG